MLLAVLGPFVNKLQLPFLLQISVPSRPPLLVAKAIASMLERFDQVRPFLAGGHFGLVSRVVDMRISPSGRGGSDGDGAGLEKPDFVVGAEFVDVCGGFGVIDGCAWCDDGCAGGAGSGFVWSGDGRAYVCYVCAWRWRVRITGERGT